MLRRRALWRSGKPARVRNLSEGMYWDLIREGGTLNGLCAPYAGTMVMRSEIFSIAAHRKTYSIYIRATGKIQ